MGLLGGPEREGGDGVEVGRRHGRRDNLEQARLPAIVGTSGGDPNRRRRRRLGGDQVEPGAVPGELVDDGAVEVARHQQIGERDREQPAQLLRIASLGRRGEQARDPGDALQRRTLGCRQGARDGAGGGRHSLLELGELLLGRSP